jgi:hypothetical protein
MMRQVGPSSTVLWAGPDIDVVEVSAHNAILDLDDRYRIAERRLLMSLGVPAVLMVGEGGDGKAAGFAAALGVAAQLQEIQNQYAAALTALATRIATENGYDDIDLVWEWNENLLENKEAAANMILKIFNAGLLSTRTALEELGFDYDAETARQNEDVSNGFREEMFGPPKAQLTTNPSGAGGESGGRPPRTEQVNTDPRTNREAVTEPKNKKAA